MGRFSFSTELNDFVKGFGAGAEVVDNAQTRKLRQQELQAKEAYYRRNEADANATNPFFEEGKSKFAPGGPGSGDFGSDSGTGSVTPFDPKKAPAFLNSMNDKYALPPGYMLNTGWIESRFGANAQSPNSSAGGMFQFTDGTAKDYGLRNKNDPVASADAAARLAVDNRKALEKALGREPSGAELYLAHQQGAKGAAALLSNPTAPAASLVGRDAVINNGGRPDMSAGDFANIWLNKYRKLERRADTRTTAAVDDEPVQYGARGGMVRQYEGGGPVSAVPVDEDSNPNDADDQKPYYAEDLMQDVGNAMGRLGEVVRGGLQGLQEKFGLNEAPAIAQADPAYQQKVEALARADGAPPPEQIAAVRNKVDPENRLGTALGTTYGMVKAYDYYLAKGDTKAAQQVAANIILFTKSQSQQLGALAVQALQEGDTTSAVKALQHAYNLKPDGTQMSVQDGKATVTDQSGKVVQQFELTPEVMMNAAMGFTKGSAFLDDLVGFASGQSGRLPKEPGGLSDEEMNQRWGGSPASAPAEAVPAAPQERVQEASAEQTNDASPEGKPLMAVPQPPQMLPMIDTRGMSGDQLRQTKEENTRRQHKNDQMLTEYRRDESEARKINAEGRLQGRQQSAAKESEMRQRRREEMKAVDDFDDVRVAGTDATVPPKQLEATREITKHLLESNEMLSTEGLRYAQQIVSPSTKLTLGETKDGGSVTMPDGETLKLTPAAFRSVKRRRDNLDAKKAEANKPSALGVLYNALTGK